MICVGCLKVDFHCRVIFTCVNEIEAMYERPRVNAKVVRGSTFTFTRDHPFTLSLFRLRTLKNWPIRGYTRSWYTGTGLLTKWYRFRSTSSPQFPPILFSYSRFLNFAYPTISLSLEQANFYTELTCRQLNSKQCTIVQWFLRANLWLNALMVWLSNISKKKMMRTAFWSVKLEKPHQIPRVHGNYRVITQFF